ncbi:MAG: DDE-type integrase/transposase/recombinase, partial [Xanthobacteraceae bacterium]
EPPHGGGVKTYILALIAKQPQLTAHHIRALAADRYKELVISGRTVSIPPIRTFQHALKSWRAAYRVELEAIRNPDGFKSRMRFTARVADPAARINELWEIDASPADLLTTDGRYSLYVCVEVYSRRLTALVTKTPRAAAVGLLVRKAIIAWGVPERIKTDNGSDFIARDTQRFFAALAIEHEKAPPFRPEKKGHVERAIGTLQRGLMRTLEGFIGHSVADRKVIEGRKAFSARLGEAPEDTFQVTLSAADLQKRVDEWCDAVYANAPHAGLKGRSPFAVAAMSAGTIRRIEDLRALDILLAPVAGKDGLRTVTKCGLRIDGAHYMAGFLGVGETVLARMDPADLGRIFVFSQDGLSYLGEAVCPDLAGIEPAAAIAAVRAEQKRLIEERIGPAKREARKVKASDFASAIHRQALAVAGKLIEFPKQTEAHDTPALAAARHAAVSEAAPTHAPEIAALTARLRAEASLPANVEVLHEETAHHRWNRARNLEKAIALSEHVSADDLMWLGGYRQGPEYRGFLATYGELVVEEKRPAEAGQG